ncbi:hypothetical protein GCM10009425_32460 [Pseudomonas asuensis]|jgi:uncharacterized membrane protein|uniref:Chlorhexidine efflux transporter domain-containing protein n=1 Tax=Pseudomonas asuensis TaxID=1825787 RepID=A0ABQ2GZA6_9PSED|nr:multidrug/biocide efflux PACE transporter [Pseudomonas asuensis]GGM19103.1 hypothetical protein GCM10009425_32460 [Pseudomonas asuensis]
MSSTSSTDRGFWERAGHALAFELIALGICAPVVAWAMDKPMGQIGVLTLMFSTIAMLWNMIFNFLFDHAQKRLGFERGLGVRLLHGCLFEAGLVVLLVPLAAWWLSISLLQALVLDIGLILFFLPYSVCFNWVYDTLRARYVRRQSISVAYEKR